MIRYSLVCDKKHTFESWFANSAAFDKQVKRGLVACPGCGSVKVEKAIMTPSLGRSGKKGAAAMGARFNEVDLIVCTRHLQGRALIQQWQGQAGLALLDEAMVAVTVGELSPIMTGSVYCGVIGVCLQAYAWDRAREWTSALSQWCAQQPEMIAFTPICLVHRAEILQLHRASITYGY